MLKTWQARISRVSSGSRCPNCAKKNNVISRNRTFIERKGSLADNHPELLEEWDYDKALYLVTHEIAKKWTMPLRNWGKVLGELEIMYPDRIG